MTTIDSITDTQIETLRTEAAQHGDHSMVTICDEALAGDTSAVEECVRVIRDAEAQQ